MERDGRIVLVLSKSQKRLAKAFIRPQEYYDSPKFRGKVFTLKEFKAWYKDVCGRFSYYDDWGGFNMPAETLAPFYGGEFNPLGFKERALLNLLRNVDRPAYVIGAAERSDQFERIVRHEFAHALFYLYPSYRQEALASLMGKPEYPALKSLMENFFDYAYHPDVVDDEIIAYALSEGQEHPEHRVLFGGISDTAHQICVSHFGFSPRYAALEYLLNCTEILRL